MNIEYLMLFVWLAIAYFIVRNFRPPFEFAYTYAGLDHFGDVDVDEHERPTWHDIAMFKKGGGSAPAPDPAIGQAALKNAELGEDWLVFAREQFDVANKRQVEQDKLANEVTQNQLDASKQAQGWATKDRERWESTFKPLQDEFINTAKNWDSAGRQSERAAEAKADVINNATQARQAAERNMASMGIKPTSGLYAGIDRAGSQATALAAAGAENTSRNAVRKEGVAMRADAINLGNGLAVNPATSLGLSSSTGSAAMGTTAGNNAQAAGLSSIMGQGYQGAMSGYGNQANILNQQYGNQINAWQAQQQASATATGGLWSGIGSAAGMGLMAF